MVASSNLATPTNYSKRRPIGGAFFSHGFGPLRLADGYFRRRATTHKLPMLAPGTAPKGAPGHHLAARWTALHASAFRNRGQTSMARYSSYKSGGWIADIGNRADAQQAMKGGAIAAWVVAAINIGIGAYILFAAPDAARPFGLTGAAIFDGMYFGIIGIFIWRYSFIGAWLGLVLFTLEKVYQWVTQPKALAGVVVAAALWFAFLNGVRGAMALRRFKREEANAPVGTEAT